MAPVEGVHGRLVRSLLRALAFLCALALVGFWIRFLLETFASATGGVPAPGAFVVTMIFAGIALAGGVAALRDAPAAVALAGLLSLIPVGLYLMLFPGTTRWIGVLDACMLVSGVILMRRFPVEPCDDLTRLPPPPGSAPPPSP